MSDFEDLYKVFILYKSDIRYRKYLEFDDDNNTFWLMWGDDSTYE